MDYLYYATGILVFLAVVLLIEGMYLTWNSAKGPEAERVARRLRMMSAGAHAGGESASMIKKRLLSESPVFQRLLLQMPRVSQLDRLLEQSGMSWTVSDLIVLSLICPVLVGGAALFLRVPLLLVLPLMLVSLSFPCCWCCAPRASGWPRWTSNCPTRWT